MVEIKKIGRDADLGNFGVSKLWPTLVDESVAFTPADADDLSYLNWADEGKWLCRVLESVYPDSEKRVWHDWRVEADVFESKQHVKVRLCDELGKGQVGDGGGGGGGLRIEVFGTKEEASAARLVAEKFFAYLQSRKPSVYSALNAIRAKEVVLVGNAENGMDVSATRQDVKRSAICRWLGR